MRLGGGGQGGGQGVGVGDVGGQGQGALAQVGALRLAVGLRVDSRVGRVKWLATTLMVEAGV